MKKAGSTDPQAIQKAIWSVDYKGVSGEIKFDQSSGVGDALRDTAYVKTANTATGKWDYVGQQKAAS